MRRPPRHTRCAVTKWLRHIHSPQLEQALLVFLSLCQSHLPCFWRVPLASFVTLAFLVCLLWFETFAFLFRPPLVSVPAPLLASLEVMRSTLWSMSFSECSRRGILYRFCSWPSISCWALACMKGCLLSFFRQLVIWKELCPYHSGRNSAEIQALNNRTNGHLCVLARVLVGHFVEGVHRSFCCVAGFSLVIDQCGFVRKYEGRLVQDLTFFLYKHFGRKRLLVRTVPTKERSFARRPFNNSTWKEVSSNISAWTKERCGPSSGYASAPSSLAFRH